MKNERLYGNFKIRNKNKKYLHELSGGLRRAEYRLYVYEHSKGHIIK